MGKRAGLWVVLVLVVGAVAGSGACGGGEPDVAGVESAISATTWTAGQAYRAGDEVAFDGRVYTCRQAHTALPGWEPPATPALWSPPTAIDGAPWAPATVYAAGQHAVYGGQIYVCRQGHTAQPGWEPPAVPALWLAEGPSTSCGRGRAQPDGTCLCDLGAAGSGCDACAAGFHDDGIACVLDVDGDYAEWPNPASAANSDPWLVAHHDQVEKVRPNLLVLLYANPHAAEDEVALVQRIADGMAEGSKHHGYADASAPPQLEYQLHVVDLRDGVGGRPPAPDGWPFENSTLYPRRPGSGPGAVLDYAQFFAADYAKHYGYADPDHPGQFLDLCALVDRGLVHEVWFVGSGDVPDANAWEVLGAMPYYTRTGNRIPGDLNRCAGNGCFETDVPVCGRSIRLGFVNYTRGPGCYMHSNGHGIEYGFKESIPALRDWFVPFAGYDLDRYGLPFSTLYGLGCDSPPCYQLPTETHAHFVYGSTPYDVDPFDPVCGNVHFPPNGTSHYDYANPQPVQSSCAGFGLHGAGGADAVETVTPERWAANGAWDDCGGEFLVWWYQNMPGHGSGQTFTDGRVMQSMWPFFYY